MKSIKSINWHCELFPINISLKIYLVKNKVYQIWANSYFVESIKFFFVYLKIFMKAHTHKKFLKHAIYSSSNKMVGKVF